MPEQPKRYRAARNDASTRSIERDIEKKYKLPSNSVSIRNPGGGNARGDKQVKNVRKSYQ